MTTVTAASCPPASARAARLGRNPSSRMTADTRSRVDSRTRGFPLITRDTVWCDTPATLATSRMLARCSM